MQHFFFRSNLLVDVDFRVMFKYFSLGSVVQLLTAMVSNFPVSFIARDRQAEADLTIIQEAFHALTAPLTSPSPYIPFMPIKVLRRTPQYLISPLGPCGCMSGGALLCLVAVMTGVFGQ